MWNVAALVANVCMIFEGGSSTYPITLHPSILRIAERVIWSMKSSYSQISWLIDSTLYRYAETLRFLDSLSSRNVKSILYIKV